MKGKRCPGEEVCTTDKLHGEIARRKGHTLDNYCHEVQTAPDPVPGEKRDPNLMIIPGCPLFPTKPENTPPRIASAVDTAEDLRSHKKMGTLAAIYPGLTSWEWACGVVAIETEELVIAEVNEERDAAAKRGAGAAGRRQQSVAPEERHERFHRMKDQDIPEFAKKWFNKPSQQEEQPEAE